jgi:hypothetical protein
MCSKWLNVGLFWLPLHPSAPLTLKLAELIHKIKTDPNDRRLVLSAWNPAALKDMALPPCHMFCQVRRAAGVREWQGDHGRRLLPCACPPCFLGSCFLCPRPAAPIRRAAWPPPHPRFSLPHPQHTRSSTSRTAS